MIKISQQSCGTGILKNEVVTLLSFYYNNRCRSVGIYVASIIGSKNL